MDDNRMYMLAGLGNPGAKYAQTRHNIGFFVVDEIAKRYSLPLNKSRFDSQYSKGIINGIKTVLVKPQSFMNRSGFPVQRLSSYFKINVSDIIVIHDDLDLAFGRIMIVKDRGHGGHNGIRSMVQALGTKNFIRVRTGVGRPEISRGVTGHVLGRFSGSEEKEIDTIVQSAADASIAIMEKGVSAAMNSFNTR